MVEVTILTSAHYNKSIRGLTIRRDNEFSLATGNKGLFIRRDIENSLATGDSGELISTRPLNSDQWLS